MYRLVNWTITPNGIYRIIARMERMTIGIASFLCDNISLSFDQSKKQGIISRINSTISPEVTKWVAHLEMRHL